MQILRVESGCSSPGGDAPRFTFSRGNSLFDVLCYDLRTLVEPGASAHEDAQHQPGVAKRSRNWWRWSMSIAKVTEISCSSSTSFEDAIAKGIERADKTLEKVKGAWVNEMKVEVEDGQVTAYRVNLKVTFVLKD